MSGPISGSGALTENASGNTLILERPNNYSGGTTIDAGTLQIGDGVLDNGTSVAGNYVVNSTLAFVSFYPQTILGNIGEAGSLVVTSPTTATLNGVVSYAGGTIINASALIFNNAASQTLSGVISGAGMLVKNGAGTLTFSGANTYTGGTTINAGIVSISGIGDSGFVSSGLGFAPPSANLLTLGTATLHTPARAMPARRARSNAPPAAPRRLMWRRAPTWTSKAARPAPVLSPSPRPTAAR